MPHRGWLLVALLVGTLGAWINAAEGWRAGPVTTAVGLTILLAVLTVGHRRRS